MTARASGQPASRGQRIRSWLRFAHTGEVYGVVGQTIAGVASAGAMVMVWTGLALTWRRFLVVKTAGVGLTVGRAPRAGGGSGGGESLGTTPVTGWDFGAESEGDVASSVTSVGGAGSSGKA